MAKAKIASKPDAGLQAQQDTIAVVAKEPIRHDGVDYAAGDTIDVTPEDADALAAAGAIGAIGDPLETA